jgi:hypothetical protein
VSGLVQVAVAGTIAEAEEIQSLLHAAGIDAELQAVAEHDPDALDDPPLRVLVAENAVDAARDTIEALTEPDDPIDAA